MIGFEKNICFHLNDEILIVSLEKVHDDKGKDYRY